MWGSREVCCSYWPNTLGGWPRSGEQERLTVPHICCSQQMWVFAADGGCLELAGWPTSAFFWRMWGSQTSILPYLIGSEAEATQCHFPSFFTQVSAQRSLPSNALPSPSTPFPVHMPVTIAESPWLLTAT